MRNLKFLDFFMLALSLSLFIQCTTDPIPGPQGEDGMDGIDGVDGVDGTASCTACHSFSHREPIEYSFNFSGHATGTAYSYAGTQANCAQCHSNQGYIQYITTGMTNPDGYTNVAPFTCTSCHGKHSTFDFENDGHDFALRNFAPTELITDPNYTMDFEGTSNNCTSCHQPRSAPPVDDGTGFYEITSSRFGPHHGPQSTFLEGIQGAEVAGSNDYPAIGSATHRKGSSCVNCHMGETTGETDGLHTFIPTDNACTSCHSNGAPSEVGGLAEDMATLEVLLTDSGLIQDGGVIPGTYTFKQAQSLWNYILVLEDSSNGIHNPGYVRPLIKNSIEYMESN